MPSRDRYEYLRDYELPHHDPYLVSRSDRGQERERGRGRGARARGRGRGIPRGRSQGRPESGREIGSPYQNKRPLGGEAEEYLISSRAKEPKAMSSQISLLTLPTQAPLNPPSSPPRHDALNSLDKLLQFSANVDAVRQSVSTEFEPSQLARMAETFLQGQSKTLEPGEVIHSPPPSAHATSPKRRAAELRELLKKKKKVEIKVEPTASPKPIPKIIPTGPSAARRSSSPRKRDEEKTLAERMRVPADANKRKSSSPVRPSARKPYDGVAERMERGPSGSYQRPLSPVRPNGSIASRDMRTETMASYSYTRREFSPVRQSTSSLVPYDGRTIRNTSTEFVDARRSTVSLIERIAEPRSVYPPRDSTVSQIRSDTTIRESVYIPPSTTYEYRREPKYDDQGRYIARQSEASWEGEYRRDAFPMEPRQSRYPPDPSPHTVEPARPVEPAVHQDVLATLAALKEQIARLEAQLPVAAPTRPVVETKPLRTVSAPQRAPSYTQPDRAHERARSPSPYRLPQDRYEREDYDRYDRRPERYEPPSPRRSPLGPQRYEERRDRPRPYARSPERAVYREPEYAHEYRGPPTRGRGRGRGR